MRRGKDAAQELACGSRYLCYIHHMARGESGRIVIEIEPEVKRRLYASLALSGSTLKDWFLKAASKYCEDTVPSGFFRPPAPGNAVPQPTNRQPSLDIHQESK